MEQQFWAARDKDGSLFLYGGKVPPIKGSCSFLWFLKNAERPDCMMISRDLFPEIKWSDKEPTKVKLVIDK